MADQLHAAVATNPLLRAEGPVLDPKLLFFGPDSKRTRVSVINLSGLTSDAAREDFMNRLQMTLFGWIKKNPSKSGLLYVIDEAQNFLPSGKQTLSLGSGVRLVAQARKSGLGMIVATGTARYSQSSGIKLHYAVFRKAECAGHNQCRAGDHCGERWQGGRSRQAQNRRVLFCQRRIGKAGKDSNANLLELSSSQSAVSG